MRDCWIQHDKCAINCPCNEKCPDGCPNPYAGHPCKTWFCQGQVYDKICAEQWEGDREACPYDKEHDCKQNDCCWVPHDDQKVPWCHYPKYELIDLPNI